MVDQDVEIEDTMNALRTKLSEVEDKARKIRSLISNLHNIAPKLVEVPDPANPSKKITAFEINALDNNTNEPMTEKDRTALKTKYLAKADSLLI